MKTLIIQEWWVLTERLSNTMKMVQNLYYKSLTEYYGLSAGICALNPKMQKRKFNKAPKVSKFDTNELSNMVFDSIFDMEHSTTKETVSQMVSSTMTTAIELLKIVIENKVRNAEQMIDEDIYNIYKKSFSAIIKATSMADDE